MSFAPYNLDGLRCARRILTWAGNTRRMLWREVNVLMTSVRMCERAYIACITKQPFPSWAQAQKVANRGSRHYKAEIYRCDLCGHWHVGHADVERDRAQRRILERRAERECA